MKFEFATAGRILFGPGRLVEVPSLCQQFGERILVVVGIMNFQIEQFLENLRKQGITLFVYEVKTEPTIEIIRASARFAAENRCQGIVSIGGGSAIDTGKSIAALLSNGGDVLDYLEIIGGGKPLRYPSLPHIAIPTTSGTGAEVTRNAVVGSSEYKVKVSLRSPTMLPTYAVVDPELTYDLPPAITATTGMDALTQVIEPYVSNAASPITDGFCREGITRAARSLRIAYEEGTKEARQDMSLASLCGGLALANAKLGAVHGFAGPIGGKVSAPHGVVCARLLPFVMDINIRALTTRFPGCEVISRYKEIAKILAGNPDAIAEDCVEWLQNLSQSLSIPSLREFGLHPEQFPELIEHAIQSSSMKGNPVQLREEELMEILERAL